MWKERPMSLNDRRRGSSPEEPREFQPSGSSVREPSGRNLIHDVGELVVAGLEHRQRSVGTTSTAPKEGVSAAIPKTATVVDPAKVLREGYTCSTPWSGELADVVVICC